MTNVSANDAWLKGLQSIMSTGDQTMARQLPTLEKLHQAVSFPMQASILTIPGRNLSYRFMLAEAAWILEGSNRVDRIKPYAKAIANFSDDGLFFKGAYGPQIARQLPYILQAFSYDLFTRRAVLTIWQPSPGDSKDYPCSLTLQFMLRRTTQFKLQLHCFFNMRSSDIWLGTPYDWFNMSALSVYLLHLFSFTKLLSPSDVQLGNLYFTTSSWHAYTSDLEKAEAVMQSTDANTMPRVLLHEPSASLQQSPELASPFEYIDMLWAAADNAEIESTDVRKLAPVATIL